MNTDLYRNPKIGVRPSEVHGWGVFANSDIKAGELLEECHGLIVNPEEYKILMRYKIKPVLCNMFSINTSNHLQSFMLPYGFGCMYNSSLESSVIAEFDSGRRLMIFKSIRDVTEGSELFINYEDTRLEMKLRGISL